MARALIVASAEPLAGKTTIAAGLARKFPDATITEIPAAEAPPSGDAKVVVVGAPETEGLANYCKSIGANLAGVILNRVPLKRTAKARAAAESAGLKVLAVVPEDKLLASPTLRDIITALEAETSFLNGSEARIIERPVIASISADPGQGYFVHVNPSAVIVRSDKPDLQLSALNAGATCLIITGAYPILSYVLDRAEADDVPMLRTQQDTVQTVETIEGLFAAAPFSGGEEKLQRITELLADLDETAL